MKITFNSKEILKHITTVGSCIKTPTTVPILENVLFDIDGTNLLLVADNSEVRSSLKLTITESEKYAACLPYDLLTSMLRSLPDGPVDFDFFDKEVIITQSGTGVYKLPVYNASDFPISNHTDAEEKIQVNSLDFIEMLNKAFSFLGNELLTFEHSVLVKIGEENTRIAAGTQKVFFEGVCDCKGKPVEITLLKGTVQYLTNSITSEEVMEISYTDNKVFFSLENRLITAVLANTKFPNYNALFEVLSDKNNKTYKINKDRLIPSLKRLSNVADNKSSIIKFDFEANSLTLSYSNPLFDYSGKETLEVEYAGEPIHTGYPADQFLNIMKQTGDDVVMRLGEITKPALITQENMKILICGMNPDFK